MTREELELGFSRWSYFKTTYIVKDGYLEAYAGGWFGNDWFGYGAPIVSTEEAAWEEIGSYLGVLVEYFHYNKHTWKC